VWDRFRRPPDYDGARVAEVSMVSIEDAPEGETVVAADRQVEIMTTITSRLNDGDAKRCSEPQDIEISVVNLNRGLAPAQRGSDGRVLHLNEHELAKLHILDGQDNCIQDSIRGIPVVDLRDAASRPRCNADTAHRVVNHEHFTKDIGAVVRIKRGVWMGPQRAIDGRNVCRRLS